MIQKQMVAVVALAATLVSGCANTFYGPKRLLQVRGLENETCPATTGSQNAGKKGSLSHRFHELGCKSFENPDDPTLARKMVQAGLTLSHMRCSDFFAQRAGNQTRQRIVERTVLPVSALLTGIISLVNFDSDAGRQDATAILALGQAATVAGLEIYEAEFLFGSANINAVRQLTSKAMAENATIILQQNTNFYEAARYLIDHQMICTPASILGLAQQALRGEEIEPAAGIQLSGNAATDQSRVAALAANFNPGKALTGDEVGALWWLVSTPQEERTTPILQAIHSRLTGLAVNPVAETSPGTFAVKQALLPGIEREVSKLSPEVVNGFAATRASIEDMLKTQGAAAPLSPVADLKFKVPASSMPPAP